MDKLNKEDVQALYLISLNKELLTEEEILSKKLVAKDTLAKLKSKSFIKMGRPVESKIFELTPKGKVIADTMEGSIKTVIDISNNF